MKKKYKNEAIIGNNKIVASFSEKGEMLRLFYPTRDYKQFIDTMETGIKINDSAIIYMQEDINNQYEQYYTENTNVLNTRIKNTYFNLVMLQTDFVSISENVILKKIVFTNENSIDLNVHFLVYSKLLSNANNMVGSKIENNILMQYNHDYTYCIFSKSPIFSYRLNNSEEEIKTASLKDKDYIGMSEDSAICFDIGLLKPGESKEFEMFLYIKENKEPLYKIIEEIEQIRKMDVKKEKEKTEKYWKKFVKEQDTLKVLTEQEKWQKRIAQKEQTEENTYQKYLEMKNIYVRSILLFPLLINNETGGIIAAIEVDEEKEHSGRYAYCWPRDAIFITKALDILNMKEQTEKFYTIFSKQTQSKNGMWEQRFYTDGRLAPCWGYQIDETASIVYGVYEHYQRTKDKEFLKQTYPMCKKAIEILEIYLVANQICDLNSTERLENIKKIDTVTLSSTPNEYFQTYESYDLWEMHEGIHLYSLSVIYAAYIAMIEIEKKQNEKAKTEKLEKIAKQIKEYCLKNLWEEETKTLKRNNKDNITDISTLGSVIPFAMLEAEQKEVINTVEKINLNLRTYTGGYIRFEKDNYMGGNNPWPIATIWMALYNIKIQNIEEAKKQIEFITKTANKHGLLAEQIDNTTMQAKWVLGLGWSHAMYIIALDQLGSVPN